MGFNLIWRPNNELPPYFDCQLVNDRLLTTHLDWQTDDDEEKICRGKTGKKRIGGRFEGGLLHNRQDYQNVTRNSQTKS